MEEQEQKHKECFRCGYFQCYYIKGQYRFTKIQQGYCIGKREIVEKHGTCAKWNSNYRKYYSARRQSMKVLHELLLEIAAIRQVLEAEEKQDEDYKQ